ncbi:mechanosensitive ion channel protein MscS [Rhizobium rhizosphaerae]|uniref:Mechanosensitive ion channel protein MscS n=1 Tax=Xaviernesmea rhizosphaerae TaxID=1672749 RepID=A0ABX3PAL6_9HYPH|nr:mechanosensitive ion channel family protein [Xaviernesmea rhizosphaerae]OQP84802.1 mechanosensitive ion channel protein MscS [Xaviernesmea rhizosphaerae]
MAAPTSSVPSVPPPPPPDLTALISAAETIANRVVSGFWVRIEAIARIPAQADALAGSIRAAGTSVTMMVLLLVFVVALAVAVFVLVKARLRWMGLIGRLLLATLLATGAGLAAAALLTSDGTLQQTVRQGAVIAAVGCLVVTLLRHIMTAGLVNPGRRPSPRVRRLRRDLVISLAWPLMGTVLQMVLRLWQAGPALTDSLVTLMVSLPSVLLFSLVAWRHRRALALAVAGPHPRSALRAHLARRWPGTVIGFLLTALISTQTALTVGAPLPGPAVLLTSIIFVATPHLDALMGEWARHGVLSTRVSIPAVAARETLRFTVVIVALAMIGTLWVAPLAASLGVETRSVAADAVQTVLIALLAAYLWNLTGSFAARAVGHAQGGDEEEGLAAPRTRLATLVPLLSGLARAVICVLAALSVLLSLGVNVWPLITGFSVFGLAIGFGSQALVKDIVSGLFFLIDDAFRFGEYIEISGAKGAVEKISIRSVSLRHHRGALATIPYGQIDKVQNYSRDWMIEKLIFRVAFDTDVEKVRRLFKKIGQEISADPAIAADLIEPFKSQGIAQVEDGTLIIRGKFKARPGRQWMIRRAVLAAVQKGFRENGIQAVPKPLLNEPPPADEAA